MIVFFRASSGIGIIGAGSGTGGDQGGSFMKTLFACTFVALLFAACGKAEEPSSGSSDGGGNGSGASAAAGSNDGEKPWDDMKKPFLSEQKMGNMVASLKDPNTPFATFESGVNAFNAEAKLKEFDATARKHGFKDGEEYRAVWARIVNASMQVTQNESNESMIKGLEESIKSAQEALKKPDVTPEVRKVYEQQIQSSQQSIESYKQMKLSVANEQDVEVFKKHRVEFEAAYQERQKK